MVMDHGQLMAIIVCKLMDESGLGGEGRSRGANQSAASTGHVTPVTDSGHQTDWIESHRLGFYGAAGLGFFFLLRLLASVTDSLQRIQCNNHRLLTRLAKNQLDDESNDVITFNTNAVNKQI